MPATDVISCTNPTETRRVQALAEGITPPRLLVVDADDISRRFLVELLATIGFQIQGASSNQEALAQWQDNRPDLIVMDLDLPELDGLGVVRQIRALEAADSATPLTPIIALTARAFERDRETAIAAGCQALLHKPCTEADLLATLAAHLNLRYTYEAPTAKPPQAPHQTLHPKDFEGLPLAWMQKLNEMAVLCYDVQVHELIEALPPNRDLLRQTLRHHADNFDMEPIIDATQLYLEQLNDPLAQG
jgi:two-component system sensor histidine kinase/response regulator